MKILFQLKKPMPEKEFDRIFRENYPVCYRQAYALLHDKEEARDIVSGVFTDLLERNIIFGGSPAGYLVTMVRNRSIDLLRHKKVEDKARRQMLQEYSIAVEHDDAHNERINDIRNFVKTELTPQTQQVLRLCYDEKLTYKEAAERLDVSVQAINKHISQALRKLREHFTLTTVSPSKTVEV